MIPSQSHAHAHVDSSLLSAAGLAVEAHPDALAHPSTFTIPESASLNAFRRHLDSHGVRYSIDPESVNTVHSRQEGLIQFPSLDHMILAFDRIPFSSYSDPAVDATPPIIIPELCVPIPIARDLARIEFSLHKPSDPHNVPLTGHELTSKLHSVYKLVQQGVRRLPGPRRTTLLGVLLKSDLTSHSDARAAATAAVLFNHPDAAKSVHAHLVKHDSSADCNPPVLVPGTAVCFSSTVDSHGHVHHGSSSSAAASAGIQRHAWDSPSRPSTAADTAQGSQSPSSASNRRERSPSHSESSPGPPKKRRIMPTLVQPLALSHALAQNHHMLDVQETSAELTLLETAILCAPPQARFVPSMFGPHGPDPFAPLRRSTLPLVLAFDPRADRSEANWLETAPVVYDVLLRTLLPSHHPRRAAVGFAPVIPPTSVTVIPPISPPGSPKSASPLTASSSWAQALVSVESSIYRLALRLYPSGHPENQASVASAAARNQIPLASADRLVFLGPLATPLGSRAIAGVYALIPPPPTAYVASPRPMSPPYASAFAHTQQPRSAAHGLLPSLTSPPPHPAAAAAAALSPSLSSLLKSPPRLTSPPPPATPLPHLQRPTSLIFVWEAGIPAQGVSERIPDDVTVYQLMGNQRVSDDLDADLLPFNTMDSDEDAARLHPLARLDVFRIDQLARAITCVQVENSCVVIVDDAGGVSVWDVDQLMALASPASALRSPPVAAAVSPADDVPHLEPPTHIELHERVHSIACRQSGSGERVFYIATAKNLFVWKENTLIPVSKFHDPEASILAATVNRSGTHAVLVFPLVVMLVPLGEQAAKMKWEHHLDVDPSRAGGHQVKVRFDPNRESLFVVVSGERMQFWDINDVDNGMFLQHDKPGVTDAAFIDSCLLPNHLVTVDWNADKARHEVVLVRPSEWVLEAVDRNANVSYYSGQLSPPSRGRRTFGP